MTQIKQIQTIQSKKHDFSITIKLIDFDFSDYDWTEDFDDEDEWLAYRGDMEDKYDNLTILFGNYDLPNSDEDETNLELYKAIHGTEESYYFRVLQDWVDETIGWCISAVQYCVDVHEPEVINTHNP